MLVIAMRAARDAIASVGGKLSLKDVFKIVLVLGLQPLSPLRAIDTELRFSHHPGRLSADILPGR